MKAARVHGRGGAPETIALGERKVVVTHLERVLLPDDGIAESDLVHDEGARTRWNATPKGA
jgi:hypothetical protein